MSQLKQYETLLRVPSLNELQNCSLSNPEVFRQYCFMVITEPYRFRPDPSYWDTEFGYVELNLRRQTLGAFIRKEFKQYKNSKFDIKFRRVQGQRAAEFIEAKQLINVELRLWLAFWAVAVQMEGRDRAPLLLARLVSEVNGLLLPYRRSSENPSEEGARDAICQLQHENRQLEKIDSDCIPFDKWVAPWSFYFVEKAIQLSEESDSFRKDWMEVVRARMAIATFQKETNARSYDRDGKMMAAGRRKKTVLDPIAETLS